MTELPDDVSPPSGPRRREPQRFAITGQVPDSRARTATLRTAHGTVRTPAFMPVGTHATVKGITPAQLLELGVQIVLCNAYHLAVRPGATLIHDLGGLHRFMGWNGPILTDSGGFQVFSLSGLRRVSDTGVEFHSHLDGAPMFLTPEEVVRVQVLLGVDIIMVLDECVAAGASWQEAERAMRRTLDWARRARTADHGADQLMFAIVQGATYADLRLRHAAELVALDFTGYAVGGVSVGEDRAITMEIAELTAAALPVEQPRYLMGVGLPEDLIRFVGMGYDLFDCVLPTRNGRNGMLFTSRGRLNIRLARFARDNNPPDPSCQCSVCRTVSRAYLRHLATANEMLGAQLASLHNLHFYLQLMRDAQTAITAGSFGSWAADRIARLTEGNDA